MTQSLIVPSYAQGFARSSGESANPDLWRGLVGAWVPSLGATGGALRDVSGYGNHGALTNMDPASDWQIGERGMALDFDGSDDHILTENDDHLPEFTLVSWINISSWSATTGYSHIVSRGSLFDDDTNYILAARTNAINSNNQRFVLYARNAATLLGGTTVHPPYPSVDLPADTWGQVVGVWKKGSQSIYLNGKFYFLVGTSTLTPGNASKAVTIGGPEVLVSQDLRFPGQIGPVQIYNRALTPNEINQLYIDPLAPFRMRDSIAFVPAAAASFIPYPHPLLPNLQGGLAA